MDARRTWLAALDALDLARDTNAYENALADASEAGRALAAASGTYYSNAAWHAEWYDRLSDWIEGRGEPGDDA